MQPSALEDRPRLWRLPLRIAAYVFFGYLGVVMVLLALENRLVYYPVAEQVPSPSREIEDVFLHCSDGTVIHAWWLPCPGSDQAILYAHGNAGNLSHRGGSLLKLRELLNASVLIFDYPGYGRSEGEPSEQGCYRAADAAHAWLTDEKKIPHRKILLYGASLGGGVMVDLASRQDHRALVLIKTFTSVPDVARGIYWWLPVPMRTVMSNQFDSLSKIGSCHRPVFIAHGDQDTLIPHSHGEALYRAANEPKQFLTMPGDGHNDGLPEEFFKSLKEFLQKHAGD